MTGFLGTLMNRLFAARKKGITVNVDDGVGEERSLAGWTRYIFGRNVFTRKFPPYVGEGEGWVTRMGQKQLIYILKKYLVTRFLVQTVPDHFYNEAQYTSGSRKYSRNLSYRSCSVCTGPSTSIMSLNS